jgi:hypothetical protein
MFLSVSWGFCIHSLYRTVNCQNVY